MMKISTNDNKKNDFDQLNILQIPNSIARRVMLQNLTVVNTVGSVLKHAKRNTATYKTSTRVVFLPVTLAN